MGAGVSHIVLRVKPAIGQPPHHLRPHADLAERVLLPGDPHRALAVAQDMLESPKIFNHARGLWGYTGVAPDGEPMSVQATGMGGPSAAIVIEELIGMGAQVLVRIGTCGAFDPTLELGELVTATRVIAGDGASRALGAGEVLEPDPALAAALQAAGGGRGVTAISSDLFYDSEGSAAASGADVVEMEAAVLFRIAELRGVRAACLLAVSDVLAGGRERIDTEALQAVGLRLGQVAVEALTG
jgi:purine-nucleoside phosphorylase